MELNWGKKLREKQKQQKAATTQNRLGGHGPRAWGGQGTLRVRGLVSSLGFRRSPSSATLGKSASPALVDSAVKWGREPPAQGSEG